MNRMPHPTCRIVLTVTPEVYDRMCGRALEHSLDVTEWATRLVIRASMPRPLSRREPEGCSRHPGFDLLAILTGRKTSETRPHPTASGIERQL